MEGCYFFCPFLSFKIQNHVLSLVLIRSFPGFFFSFSLLGVFVVVVVLFLSFLDFLSSFANFSQPCSIASRINKDKKVKQKYQKSKILTSLFLMKKQENYAYDPVRKLSFIRNSFSVRCEQDILPTFKFI